MIEKIRTKKCTGMCGLVLELTKENFKSRKDSDDGFRNQCKNCHGKGISSHIIIENGAKYQICAGECKNKLELNSENFDWHYKSKAVYHIWCRDCMKKYKKMHYQLNKKTISENAKEKRNQPETKKKNRERNIKYCKTKNIIKENGILYRICISCNIKNELNNDNFNYAYKNKEAYDLICKICVSKYYQINKEKILQQANEYQKQKRLEGSVWAIMKDSSRSVNKMLKSQKSSKKGISSKSKFPFTEITLKNHIESFFKLPENYWMNWDNQGKYNIKTWNDNDPSTWTWQLDHIIPQSNLKYDSYDRPNFLKCWSLSNLRPLRSKDNILDGARRTRHNPKSQGKNK